MKVLRKYNQHRRDCSIDLKCEGCGAERTNRSAYDDRNFWDNVVPDMRCDECDESTNSLGLKAAVMPTRYAAHQVV